MGCFHSIDAVLNPYNHDPTEMEGQAEPEVVATRGGGATPAGAGGGGAPVGGTSGHSGAGDGGMLPATVE